MQQLRIPFHRPQIADDEIEDVVTTLRSGWLTTGPRTKQFETDFARYVGAKYAVAVNSATAALHLALEAIGLERGDAVLVPTMTFAATAEVVRYFDAIPLLVDCRSDDMNIDCAHARLVAEAARRGGLRLRAIIPVHYGGQIVEMCALRELALEYGIDIVEDAAHCCPAFYRVPGETEWKSVGSESTIACYSFYANKCITTGEGGMACTNHAALADRMRIMALHGISKDAWKRFTAEGSWYYEIIAPGFKYNLTDIASALGLRQLQKANRFRAERQRVADTYSSLLNDCPALELPCRWADRIHSWHLYPVRIKLETLRIDRAAIIEELKAAGIGTSVHWMPLHMHPYYRDKFGYKPADLPTSAAIYPRLISLPIYPSLTGEELDSVCSTLRGICLRHSR